MNRTVTDPAAWIRDLVAPIYRAAPLLAAAANDAAELHPGNAVELRRAALLLRPAVLALAALVAELSTAGDGPRRWMPCLSCCGAGAVACPRCAGSGAELDDVEASR